MKLFVSSFPAYKTCNVNTILERKASIECAFGDSYLFPTSISIIFVPVKY